MLSYGDFVRRGAQTFRTNYTFDRRLANSQRYVQGRFTRERFEAVLEAVSRPVKFQRVPEPTEADLLGNLLGQPGTLAELLPESMPETMAALFRKATYGGTVNTGELHAFPHIAEWLRGQKIDPEKAVLRLTANVGFGLHVPGLGNGQGSSILVVGPRP